MPLLISLGLAACLGYLAQSTGLCMVRGMKQWMAGKSGFMVAILCSGILAWVAGISAECLNLDSPFRRYRFAFQFAIGGFLFGLGSAFNQGCGVSTLTSLSRGETKMLATLLGWLVGWFLVESFLPDLSAIPLDHPGCLTFGLLAAASGLILIWLIRSNNERRKLWLGTLGIGLLSGILFLLEREWAPSSLFRDLSAALRGEHDELWPSMVRFQIFASLLAGMAFAGWRAERLSLIFPNAKGALKHLIAGTLMGIGGALAMGGNTTQLLLFMPMLSPSGITAVASMLAGLYFGLKMSLGTTVRD